MSQLIRRGLAAVLAVGCLAACGPSVEARWNDSAAASASDSPTPPGQGQSPEPTASPEPSDPATTDDSGVASCYDGQCEITVTGPTEIPLDKRFGIARLAVIAVKSGQVGFEYRSESGAMGYAWVGGNGKVILGPVHIDVVAEGNSAHLTISVDG